MSTTDRFRVVFVGLFVLASLTALLGWFFFDLDPRGLSPLLGWLAGAVGVGEASNVGKRATWKREAVGYDGAAADAIRKDG